MTLGYLRGRSTARSTPSSWGRTCAVVMLALLVSAAPRAAELCDATCTRAHEPASASARGPAHCAGHATSGHTPFSNQAATAHGCGMHAHLPASPVQLAATPVAAGQTRLSPPRPLQTAMLQVAGLSSSIAQAPPIGAPREHPAARASRSRPLTLALRI